MTNHSENTKSDTCDNNVLAVAFNSNLFVGNRPSDEDIIRVIKFLKNKTEISNSRLQLEFIKGYNWAHKIMDILEENQLVSEFDGKSQYRKVIADAKILEREIVVLDTSEFL